MPIFTAINLKNSVMKKLYTFLFMAVAATSFAQSPILTAILDGPCTGGTPKVLEIYASGTVNFAQYTLQNQTNANTTWGAPQDLSALGTRTNQFVYVVMSNSTPAIVVAEYPFITAANSLESPTMNLNGDDRVRIINTASTAVIDQFGVSDVDGTGTTWEWLDTYATRNSGTGPDAGFVEANWTFHAVDFLDGKGTCNGAAPLATSAPLGQYSLKTAQYAIAGLKVYPNPVTGGTLYIDSNSSASKSVVIYDVVGKQVLKANTTNAVNVSSLTGGVYVLKITEDGKTATRKLVIR